MSSRQFGHGTCRSSGKYLKLPEDELFDGSTFYRAAAKYCDSGIPIRQRRDYWACRNQAASYRQAAW